MYSPLHIEDRGSLTATGLLPIIDSEIESIKEFENSSSLTQSQQTRLQLYLGNLTELQEALDKLIILHVENPAQLRRLFNLWEKIVNAMSTLSQYTHEPVTIFSEDKEIRNEETNFKIQEDYQILRVSQLNEFLDPNCEEAVKKEILNVDKDGTNEQDCLICGDTLPREEFFSLSNCGHIYCKECLLKYITVKINTGEVRTTCCPDLNCGIDISEPNVESLLSTDLFAKFQRFLFLDRLRENENARWCPKPDCNFAVIVTDEVRYSPLFPKLTCDNCHTEFCFDCSNIWHEGQPCNSAKDKFSKKELARLNKWKKKHSQPCKKCHANVEKSGGCNHMTCRCGYQWCWICGEEYQWQHYYEGKCKGLHVSDHPTFDKALLMGKKAGKIGAVGAGVVIATPVVVGAGLVALGIAIPVVCVAVPIGGAYYIKKKRESRKNRWER